MADLNVLQSTETVRIAGTNPATGIETNLVDVDAVGRIAIKLNDGSGLALNSTNGQLQATDVVNTAGQFQAQSVTTTAAIAKGAGSHLTNRKILIITPTNGVVYWGTANTVTVVNGQPIFKNQSATWAFTENVDIWLISAGTVDCRITEAS